MFRRLGEKVWSIIDHKFANKTDAVKVDSFSIANRTKDNFDIAYTDSNGVCSDRGAHSLELLHRLRKEPDLEILAGFPENDTPPADVKRIPERGFVSFEKHLILSAGHKISKNVSKWASKTRFEHEIGKNVSESVLNGRFEHEISENMCESSNYSIPLDAECHKYMTLMHRKLCRPVWPGI